MSWRDAEATFEDDVTGRDPIPRMLLDATARHGNRPAQAYKGVGGRAITPDVLPEASPGEFATLTYRDLGSLVETLAGGFRHLGVSRGDRVGILAHTRLEWALCDFGILATGGVVTTLYPGSSTDRIRTLLDDSGASGIVVGGDSLDRVVEVAPDTDLEFIVSLERPPPALADRDDVLALDEVHEHGRSVDPDTVDSWVDAIDPGDLASIIYTSGTTGRPKGVPLTHWNLKSNVDQCRARFGPRPDSHGAPTIDSDSRTVSFLPLAHVFERLAGHFLMFASGALVAYAESPDTLHDDFAAIRPTTGTSVPRVYERIYAAIREEAAESSISRRVFGWATEVGRQFANADDPGPLLAAKYRVADRLVFSKVRSALGGELEFLISGGGSLSPELCTLYHGMGLPILEGYGLTETSPVVAVNPPEAPRIGTVGPPVVDLDVRIETSGIDTDAFDESGEIGELLVSGPNVVEGYWDNPEGTEAAFEDGWFRTGDIVRRDDDGYLTFLERRKELIVLSTGKNVAPGPIEDAFATSDYVEQCMLVGDGRKFVGALVVPAEGPIRDWADAVGIELPSSRSGMCRHERVRALIRGEIDRVNETLEYEERIKEFSLVPDEFTQENGLLTPTLKKKRRTIFDHYADDVESIYS